MRQRRGEGGEWAEIENRLAQPYGRAYFETADGHLIQANTYMESMRLKIEVFIDGQWSSDWCKVASAPEELPALPRRFMPTRWRYAWPRSSREVGTRRKIKRYKMDIDPDLKFFQTGGPWTSARAFVGHLRRQNPDVRALTDEQYHERRAQRAIGGP